MFGSIGVCMEKVRKKVNIIWERSFKRRKNFNFYKNNINGYDLDLCKIGNYILFVGGDDICFL